MVSYHVDFESLAWESPMQGVRQKSIRHGSKQLRLVEYSRDMEPHWCEKGHIGYVIEGQFEIEFAGGTRMFYAGDGVFIPDGIEHKHRATVITELVKVVFVEGV
jgi:quercetin dioxygenase-like cupin family protein